jgi:hypothetical protein
VYFIPMMDTDAGSYLLDVQPYTKVRVGSLYDEKIQETDIDV